MEEKDYTPQTAQERKIADLERELREAQNQRLKSIEETLGSHGTTLDLILQNTAQLPDLRSKVNSHEIAVNRANGGLAVVTFLIVCWEFFKALVLKKW